MSSAYHSGPSWIIKIRGFQQPPGKCRQWRVRLADVPDPHAHAVRCEAICRELEVNPTPILIREAAQLRAIPADIADALLGNNTTWDREAPHSRISSLGLSAKASSLSSPFSLLTLAAAHPSSKREEAKPREYDRHVRDLKRFIQWSGIHDVHHLTLDRVMDYVADLEERGQRPDTIRHAILWVRRASAIAASTLGLPDRLADFVLIRHHTPTPILVYPLADILKATEALHIAGRRREAAAIALGGLVGLRPSEIAAAKVGHLAQLDTHLTLHVGQKNLSSIRTLPLPRYVQRLVEPLATERPPEAPLIARSWRTRAEQHYTLDNLGDLLGQAMTDALGYTLPPKSLRKSFATWADEEGLTLREFEPYLGHARSDVLTVTGRHYHARRDARALIPVATKIDTTIARVLQRSATEEAEPLIPYG